MGGIYDVTGKTGIILPEDDITAADQDVLRFDALHRGPLLSSAATIELYLRSLAYMHRSHTGVNPLGKCTALNCCFRVKKRRRRPT